MAINLYSSYDDIYKNIYDANKTTLDNQLAANQSKYDLQKNAITQQYNSDIADTTTAYDDEFTQNAVQRQINEQKVAETMANLGLTDSGLNRTQQTAVQLSYANNKANIERQKQSVIDKLNLALSQNMASLDTNKIETDQGIRDAYDSSVSTQAGNVYKSNQTALADMYKAEQDAQAKMYTESVKAASQTSKPGDTNFFYTLQRVDDDNNVVYYTGSDGKTYKFAKGYNPYTRSVNSKATNEAVAKYGTFKNGYQPKGVIVVDGNGNKYNGGKLTSTGEKTNIFGVEQNVFKDQRGRYWVWNGRNNTYEEVTK